MSVPTTERAGRVVVKVSSATISVPLPTEVTLTSVPTTKPANVRPHDGALAGRIRGNAAPSSRVAATTISVKASAWVMTEST